MTKTLKELEGALERLNESLEPSGYMVKVGHRNGYTAIDKYRLNGNMIDYLEAGLTDKQALAIVYMMCKTAEMISNPIKQN